MRNETRRRMRRGDIGLALIRHQPGCHEDDGKHMMAMADVMTIVVMASICIASLGDVMV